MLLLEKLVEGLDIEVQPFAVCRVGTDASLSIPAFEEAMVHYTVAGEGVAAVSASRRIDLRPGTMIVVPRKTTHEVTATPPGAAMPADLGRCEFGQEGIQLIESGWQGAGIVLTCGRVHATYQTVHHLFDYLPSAIVERARPGDAIWNAFSTLVGELANPQPGTAAMTAALIRQSLLALLRRHSERGVCKVPWLSALEHPRIGLAVREVLLHPGQPYTLELLARRAGMSRSAFCEHFARTFGRTVMDFVKEVRLRQAARLLTGTTRPVKAISAEVGYQSRSHFTHAFKESFGLHPAAYRQQQHAAAQERLQVRHAS